MIVPTAEQAAIVAYPLLPLRIAAGAGTGKTTTIAARVVHLVTQIGVEPERILGITFTNKAAGELGDRIRQMLHDPDLENPVEEGRDVEVHTYHGFAAQILREFGALVGVERRSPVITPTFTRQLMSHVVRSVDLPRLDATYAGTVEDLRRLASALGDHLLTAEELVVPAHDPGSPWEIRADLLRGLAEYHREKRRLGVTDYADLMVMAHRLVVRFPDVATEIRGRYQAVLLDEYQDTNPGQREVLRALFGPGFPVTAVGDIDQTIYEWRGASPHNFERFNDHFPLADGSNSETLHLTENRRSHPSIISVANVVRAQTESGQPDLVPLPGRIGGEVVVAWHDSAVAEAEWLAQQLAGLHGQHRWKDMAVLFRKNKDMVLVHDALRAAGIPVEVANLGGLLAIPEVSDLRAWLRIIQDPTDEPALFRVLTGSRFRLGLADLYRLGRWVRSRNRQTVEASDHEISPTHLLLEGIDHLDEIPELRPQARQAIERFRDQYRYLLTAAQGVTLVELCRRILDHIGAWQDLAALPDTEQLTARLNLYRFLDLTEDWSPLEGRPSLDAFLDYLRLMEGDASEELDTARLSGEDAVILLTVHRAKGLEWEVVFIPACYQNNFPSRSFGFENPYLSGKYLPYELRLDHQGLPPITASMDKKEADGVLRQHHLIQEWRVAYVALTRAKQRLFVSGAHWYGHPEPTTRAVKPSPLWTLVAQHPAVRVESSPGPPPPRPSLLRFESKAPDPDPVFVSGWDDALRREMDNPGWARARAEELGDALAFDGEHSEMVQMVLDLPPEKPESSQPRAQTSVTGLVTYASCPQQFYWSEVDRLPRRPNSAARRGTEVHRLIELHHRGQMAFDDLDVHLYDFGQNEDGPEDLGPSSPDAFTAFSNSRFATDKPWLVEAPFELPLGPLRLRGRIDAIYRPKEVEWEIVDFKSGRRPPPSPGTDDPRRVQLEAYAVAASQGLISPIPPERLRVTFAYLGGRVEEVTEEADHDWLAEASTRLAQLADGIEQGNFAPRPSQRCQGCDFLRFCPAGLSFLDSGPG
ncbi:MAG TPA: ATP-dependent DNA helicase [Acidimicrobiia bacterium]|nr:ATP-dependent DNA helicase [Acidimicrobiia bacterium]